MGWLKRLFGGEAEEALRNPQYSEREQEYYKAMGRQWARETPADRTESLLRDAEQRRRYGSLPGDHPE